MFIISAEAVPSKTNHNGLLVSVLRATSHINSAHWKVLKLSIIAKRGMSCERCGQHKMSVDLHHLTYVRFGRELPEDVKLLCRDCHKLMHPRN